MKYEQWVISVILAMIYSGQAAKAWAYSSSPSEEAIGYLGAILFTIVIVGLVLIVFKIKQNRLAAHLAQLKTRDPGFNEQVFQSKVSTLFFAIQQAWLQRDMEPVHCFLSDPVFSRFHSKLEQHIRDHTFNRLDELSLDRAAIIGIRSDANYDRIDVWISAKAKDYTVDERGNKVSGSTKFRTWNEQWSFTRSATTSLKEDANSAVCPHCVLPLPMSTAEECGICKLSQCYFEWILTEISKLSLPQDDLNYSQSNS